MEEVAYINMGSFESDKFQFTSNHSTHEGGGILLTDSNATISDSNFTENSTQIIMAVVF